MELAWRLQVRWSGNELNNGPYHNNNKNSTTLWDIQGVPRRAAEYHQVELVTYRGE